MSQPTEQEDGSAGLPFDLLDDTMDTLSDAVLDCMPSPPDSAVLYRQLGLSDGTDHMGLDLSTGAYEMETGAGPDTQGGYLGDPPPAPAIFVMPGAAGCSEAEQPPGPDEMHRRTSDESMQSTEKSNKKHAPLGQWLTPPQLLYYGMKKNKSELDVPSAGVMPMMATGGGQRAPPAPSNPGSMPQGVGATFPMPAPYAMPMPPPSSSSSSSSSTSSSMPPPPPLPSAPAFPANFRPPPLGSLPRSVSFEGLTQYNSYSLHNMGLPLMLPYPSIVQMQGAMAYHTPGGMAMMVQPPQPQEGGSQPAIGEMPPPPARLGQSRRYQSTDPAPGGTMAGGISSTGRGAMQMGGANATGAGGPSDPGSLRRQTLSCPDLTNIAMRPMDMPTGNAESMARSTTTESGGASSSTFGPYTPLGALPPFSALQVQGLLGPLLPDDLTGYGRAMAACPDFQRAMAGNLKLGSEEEDRRQKRLARNRAAARLRRQRKKNLVDTYEQEVALLEANRKRLQEHEWGTDDDGTLEDALGRAKVLDMLTLEQAREATDSLLQDQVALLQPLKDDVTAMDVFAAALCLDSAQGMSEEERQQLTELRGQLMRDLELTGEQVAQLQSLLGPEPCVAEQASIEEIERGLQALRAGSDECLRQTEMCQGIVRAGFEKAQTRRFLGWADTNREAVEQLEYGSQDNTAPPPSGQLKADPDAPGSDRKPSARGKASSKPEEEQQPPVFHFFGEGVQ